MIHRTIYHESQFMAKALSSNQVFRISNNCIVTNHHALGLASGTCCIKNISYSFWYCMSPLLSRVSALSPKFLTR